jgi:hypothetical protein
MDGITSFCEYLTSLFQTEVEQLLVSLSISKSMSLVLSFFLTIIEEIAFKGEGTLNYTAVATKIVQIVEQTLKACICFFIIFLYIFFIIIFCFVFVFCFFSSSSSSFFLILCLGEKTDYG